jgi:two-component system, NtrC family, sensor kinase
MTPTFDNELADLRRVNAELLERLDERTSERDEALDQQTATTEVLEVINSSPGNLGGVFDAMLEKAMRLCDATIGALWTYDGEQFLLAALRGGSQELFDIFTKPVKVYDRMSTRARALRGEHVTHILDARESEAYLTGDLYRRAMVDLGGGRSMVTISPKGRCRAWDRYDLPARSAAILAQADHAVAELRRPGGHRDGERA